MKPRVLDEMASVVTRLKEDFHLSLTDEDFAFARDELLHVFLHEACHAALYRAIPWLLRLHDDEHVLIDEVLARILESDLAPAFGLTPHTVEEHMEEFSRYDLKFPLSAEQYVHLADVWRERYGASRDVAAFAEYARKYLLG
ncbi:MAG: hypothetical protein QME93_12525 [Bacillota bacterium]|nr:hypothetical protein [Bacillota bacterium]MDI7250869.1 hypothetical protein [Bacillota bacterium]